MAHPARRLARRDLQRNPGRFLIVALGIALGTAIMVGAATSRSASQGAVDGAIGAYSGGADVAAVPVGSSTGTLPASADLLRQAPGVRLARGVVTASVRAEASPGQSVETTRIVASEGDPDEALGGATIVRGANYRPGHRELVVTTSLARWLGAEPGDVVHLDGPTSVEVTLVGVIDNAGVGLADGGNTGVVDLDTARAINAMDGGYSMLRLWLDDPAAVDSWVRANAPGAPTGVVLQPAGAQGAVIRDLTSTISSGLDLLAAVTLFLGALLCYHLNQIAAASDRRRTALLLAVGATRRDARLVIVLRSTIIALAGAAAGCVIGSAIGRVMAPTVARLLGLIPSEASPTPLVYLLAVVAALAISAVSLAAMPLKHVRPVEALARSHAEARRTDPHPLVGFVIVVLLAGSLLLPFMPAGLLVAVGLVLIVAATLTIRDAVIWHTSRRTSGTSRRPVAMLALRSVAADAASTGVAMGLLMAAFAVSLSAVVAQNAVTDSVEAGLAREFGADLQVQSTQPLDARVDELRHVRGVERATLISFGATVATSDASMARDPANEIALPLVAIDPTTYFDVADLTWRHGDGTEARAALAAGGAIVLSQPLADQLSVGRGDVVRLRGPNGTVELRVVATFTSFAGTSGVVSADDGRAHLGMLESRDALIDTAPGQEHRVAFELSEAFPGMRPLFLTTIRSQIQTQLLSLWGIAYSSLLVTAGLAAIGLGASLHASISRREDELRLLRQMGATARQIIRLVMIETAAIVVIGFVAAVPVGFVLAHVTLEVFRQGTSATIPYAVPVVPLLVFPITVVPIAALAAILPARRATRIPLTPG